MVDSHDTTYFNHVKNELGYIIETYNSTIRYKILLSFNWGGTILGLWLTYNYSKIYDNNTYISHFEEDFYPINDKWLEDSINLLNNTETNYIYIGEHIPPENLSLIQNNIKLVQNNEFTNIINKYYNTSYTNCCWTDGGFYFSSIDKLQVIENTIGIFHKGNCEEKYNHYIDGIVLGEVGFPTILYNNNFRFIGLYRDHYFIHQD